jgi:putative transcriptional regulator
MSGREETQAGMTGGGLAGKLIIAEPMLGDPNFERSVVFMVEHSPEGAVGVVLNRPSELEVAAVLPEWDGIAAEPRVFHVGGPVEHNSVLALARPRPGTSPDGWTRVVGDVGSVDLERSAEDVGPTLAEVRFFAGYAGWGPGQLDAELTQNAWLVVDAVPSDVFAPDPEAMWRSVLRRQGGKLGMLADFPTHPSMN